MSIKVEVPMSIDLGLLREQKLWLIAQKLGDPNVEGILGILDQIQDEIVRQGLATKEEVFG